MNPHIPLYGELIALLTTLSWTIGIFPFTEAARRLGPNSTNHFRLLLAIIFLTLILLLGFRMSFSGIISTPLPEHWLWFGLSGFIGLAMGDFFGFTSFAILGTKTGSVITTLSPGVALVFGYLLVGEKINVIGIFGMAITISGIIWISLSKKETSKIPDYGQGNIRKGIIFGILGAICQGAGLVLSKKGMQFSSPGHELLPVHMTWIRMTVGTGVVFFLTLITGKLKTIAKPVIENKNNGAWFALGGTIFGPVIGVSLSMYAVSLIEVSVAQTIFALLPVTVLPVGYLFYREKITLHSILGALVSVVGVFILIWRNDIASWF